MKETIENQQYDEERALYHLEDSKVVNCIFAGAKDGESALKESRNIAVDKCQFFLRYPLWHVKNFSVKESSFGELSRAAFWYDENGTFEGCKLMGIKALRECSNIVLDNCQIDSKEFGWKCTEITLKNTEINSEYLLFDSNNIILNNIKMKGKYSFQYNNNLEINNCNLDTKDAFWHSKNVIVKNSVVKGEYLGWYSSNLTFINCKIIGTQPLCYCKDLKLINCTMENCDLAFEYSEVEADIKGNVDSIKNPKSGRIVVDSVNQIIKDNPVIECKGEVVIR